MRHTAAAVDVVCGSACDVPRPELSFYSDQTLRARRESYSVPPLSAREAQSEQSILSQACNKPLIVFEIIFYSLTPVILKRKLHFMYQRAS